VTVGKGVAVGGVALGAGVGVGADTGAQADNTRLTSKNTSNVRFIVRVLLYQLPPRLFRPNAQAVRPQGRSERLASGGCSAGTFLFPLVVFLEMIPDSPACGNGRHCLSAVASLILAR